MGFLNEYAGGGTRIEVAPGWWVEIKRALTVADVTEAQQALTTTPRMVTRPGEAGGEVAMAMDYASYREVLVTRALLAWNLTDEQDQVLPLTRESVRRLPVEVFELIYERVEPLARRRPPEEQAAFRHGAPASVARDGAAPAGAHALSA